MDRPSRLPAELVDALERLGARLRGRGGAEAEVARAIALLNRLPAAAAPAADRELAGLAGLRHHYPERRTGLVARLRPAPDYRAWMRALPGLEWVFLHHLDGHAREAALERVQGPVPSPFLASALGYRLNDWVPQVRAAAAGAVARSFAATAAATLAPAALFLLDRGRHWQRWEGEEAILAEAFDRPDVVERLAAAIQGSAGGPMARTLVSALRRPAMDRHLPTLALDSVQPAVRAVALEALIRGKARWPAGFERRWVDKSMGRWTMAAAYAERTIAAPSPPEPFILQALRDPSVAVRKVGLAGLIGRGRIPGAAAPLVRAFATDPSRGVRERATFALGQAGRGGEADPPSP